MAGLSICVFSSSSATIDAAYFEAADELGRLIGDRGHTLVYGGASVGLMGTLARAVHRHGGRVTGALPQPLLDRELAFEDADELVITAGLRERKAFMESRADGFIALPGGLGTLEETVEILTLKQLGLHGKAVVLVNTSGFWDPLLHMLAHMQRASFVRPEATGLFHVANTPPQALDLLERYTPPPPGKTWY